MNTSRSVIQVVPRLGTYADGVADYARTLATALRAADRINSSFLCGDPLEGPDLHSGVDRVAVIEDRSATKLLLALESPGEKRGELAHTNVVLHYVNYGYSPRGCPFWLVDGLEEWKWRNRQARLITIFHEVYASGPVWRSSFWLSPVQRRLAARLARLSDFAITSSEVYRRILVGWAPANVDRTWVRPVFSTIGEPAEFVAWGRREPCMAVLGRAGTEARAYGPYRQSLATTARALGIESVIDIGPRLKAVPAELDGIRVRTTGQLPREEVSRLLSGCRAGFLDYPSDVLGKSTVFAAYCAHGVIPAITHVRGAELDGLRDGEHFLLAKSRQAGVPISAGTLARIANTVREWYGGHSIAVHASALAAIVQ